MKTKKVILSNLFEFPSIKGLTKEFILNHPGNIPVYGGRITDNPVGKIADCLDGVKYFENCLAWNREGSVGYVFWHKHKFSTNDHHRPMILKSEYINQIDLNFMQMIIQNTLLSLGFEWSKTASKEKIKNIEVEIPIDNDDIFNIELQQQIFKRNYRIYKTQKQLKEYYELLNNLTVVLNEDFPYITLNISDVRYFSLTIGKRIILNKDTITNGIPAYSANVSTPFGFVRESIFHDFSTPSLIWGIDGNFNWNYIPAYKPFAPTDHCGVLRIKDKNILPEYVVIVLQNNKNSYGFNRTFRASLRNIKENISINIPVNETGQFDVIKQKEIIKKYQLIENIRTSISNRLGLLIDSVVEY